MATVVTAGTAPSPQAHVPRISQGAPIALVVSPGAYAQASDQLVRDLVNDIRQALINHGLLG